MIKLEKGHQESAQDKKSIANIENVIAEIEEQQQNTDDECPKPPLPFYFKDDWFDEQMKRRSDMIHSRCLKERANLPAEPSNKHLKKVL